MFTLARFPIPWPDKCKTSFYRSHATFYYTTDLRHFERSARLAKFILTVSFLSLSQERLTNER